MLTQAPITAMLPVKDLGRAREFYERKLGLEPGGLQPDGKFLIRCNGTTLGLFPKPEGKRVPRRRRARGGSARARDGLR